jgi:hypothetical protein
VDAEEMRESAIPPGDGRGTVYCEATMAKEPPLAAFNLDFGFLRNIF